MTTDNPLGSTTRIRIGDEWTDQILVRCLRASVITGEDTGMLVEDPRGVIRMGKDPANDLVLTDESVSRFHAVLSLTRDGIRLEDAESKNGTFVNDVRIRDANLESGTEIVVGTTRLRVDMGESEYLAMASPREEFRGLVGSSEAMTRVYGLIETLGPTPITVYLHGESGTGKELVARALHQESGRAGPLVTFDCTAPSRDLIRAALFGHERGAFTGADRRRDGAFQQAHGGTLFLDEIGELPLDVQPVLLRALESRVVQRVGGLDTDPLDLRLVVATNRDLVAMVEDGGFRQDLYYRVAVARIDLPPLRERRADIPALVHHMVEGLGLGTRISRPALQKLSAHHWPGNVRELRNAVEVLAHRFPERTVMPADVTLPGTAAPPATDERPLEEIERQAIIEAWERFDRNQVRAAESLQIGLSTLRRKLKKYGMI